MQNEVDKEAVVLGENDGEAKGEEKKDEEKPDTEILGQEEQPVIRNSFIGKGKNFPRKLVH